MSRTHLTVRECRAQVVLRELQRTPVGRLEDIALLRALASWRPDVLGQAIADLVHDGLLADDATGRLVVGGEAT